MKCFNWVKVATFIDYMVLLFPNDTKIALWWGENGDLCNCSQPTAIHSNKTSLLGTSVQISL